MPQAAQSHQDQPRHLGFQYKSKANIAGLPLVHVSLAFRPNGTPVPACGVLAIGQFAVGAVTVSQFGLGLLSLSQITIAGLAITQIGIAYSLIAQAGIYVNSGAGQAVRSLAEILQLF